MKLLYENNLTFKIEGDNKDEPTLPLFLLLIFLSENNFSELNEIVYIAQYGELKNMTCNICNLL